MNNKKVLIIDDDPELCEEIVDIFKNEGYDAVSSCDPYKGLALIEKGGHDIILLDYKMPGLTGADILKSLKRKMIYAHIFIISGKPFIENIIKEEGLSDMVSAVIPKPIDFETLIGKIKSLPRET